MMELLLVTACAGGGLAAGLTAGRLYRDRERSGLRQRIKAQGAFDGNTASSEGDPTVGSLSGLDRFCCKGLAARVLAYALELERRLAFKSTQPISAKLPILGHRAEAFLSAHARKAGVDGRLGSTALTEARLRLMATAACVGALFGACLSNELMVFGLVAGAVLGWKSPGWAIKREEAARLALLDNELPEMLEVVALAMRSGMTFDKGFSLYHAHFSSPFARECASAQHHWELGLLPREEALRKLSESYDSPLLGRVVDHIIRSLRFGTAMAESLEASAAEARAVRRTRREEQVAKAPVKMMIPTGTLILPAMLILVLGPVLLELMAGF